MQQRHDNQFIRSLLTKFEEDQIATTHHIIQEIESNSAETLPLLNTLNLLLNNKALPSRQRRDVAGIARLVADSNIFSYLESLIKTELRKSSSSVDSQAIFLETIKLIGGICWENPHFIDNILTSSSTIIDLLMEMLNNAETIPVKDDSLITIVNFFHSISLKEGVIRKEKMPKIFTCFLEQIFTNNKFYDCIESKKFTVLFSTINKFHGNVHQIDKCIFNAAMRAVLFLNEEYKNIEQQYLQISQAQEFQRLQERIKFVDRRLVGVLRMQEKSRGGIFQKIDPLNFLGFLKTLAKIAVRRSIVFVESPYDNKVLINAMQEIIKDIKEWKEHLKHKFKEVVPKEADNQMEAEEEQKMKQPEIESEAQAQQDREVSLVNADTANSSYYEQMRPQFNAFSRIYKSLCSFSENYYVIVSCTIDHIINLESEIRLYEGNFDKKDTQPQMKDQIDGKKQPTNQILQFKLQVEGSRLDRLLSLFMRLMDQKQLMKDDWYKIIVSRLTTVFHIFSTKGLQRHIKTVHSLIPDLNNMTTESNISKNRFIFEKIEQDSLKTHLHLKITAIQNAKNLISYTIIQFCYHLSEYSQYLEHINKYFLSEVIVYFNTAYLEEMQKQDRLSMTDIERLRMMTKVVTELFPNIHKCNKEELMRLKLYNYCLLTDETSMDAFGFVAKVINLICKHDLASTEELVDTIQNREEMVKTIFVKLIIHRVRTFFATVITFYDDLRKLSTPRTIESPAGSFELGQSFMFQGHSAYLRCLSRALKQVLLGHRQNSLKEEVSGMLLLKLYDFRTLDKYEGETQQLEAREQNFRNNQTNLFNKQLQQCCWQTFGWLLQNLGSPIHKLSMLVKKLLHYRREQTIFEIERSSFNQNQLQYAYNCFRKVSENINTSFFILEGKHLNLGVKMAKKKKKIHEDIQFQLEKEVVKLANTCIIVSQFMIESNNLGLTEKKLLVIPETYIYSMLEFATLYISKFEAELHFPDQANYLIQATLWLIECYLAYKHLLQQSKLQNKKDKKKLRKAKRNKDRKQRIKARKIEKKIGQNKPESKDEKVAVSLLQVEDKENQQLLPQKAERHRPRKQKTKQNKQKPEVKHKFQQRTLQKNQSKTNLHSQNKTSKDQPLKHKKTAKKTKEKSTLQAKVEEYVKFILLASNHSSKPFIKCLTLQSILKFISVNLKANYLSKPATKHFELSLNIFLEQLLKIRLTDEKIVGFHLVLSRLGLKLISEEHVKVDYQTGIKRYFFDNGDKKITLSEFLKFLELNFKKPPNLLHFVDIIYEEPEGKGESVEKSKKILPFTVQNFTGIIETGKTKDCSVRIKEGVDLNMILVKHQNQSSRKKSSNALEEDKKEKWIKLSEYVPDGEINVFVVHLISHIVNKLITEVDYYLDYIERKEARHEELLDSRQPVEPFNTKAVIYTIQYLIRESPTLVPWIAKFKCKKFILNALKSDALKDKDKTSKYVFSLLNKYDQHTESISQIGFLQVILRLVSPFLLSTISGLVFELCLDSTPLVQNGRGNEKEKEIKQAEKQQPNYVSFGSVVRQKTISQIQSILFGGHPLQNLIRKAACLNLLTVLMNNREMSKLLLEANFINKLHGQYTSIMKKYEQSSEAVPLPGIYFIKLYIPFFLQPISILQELNIAFHHNKKLNKNPGKLLLNSLIMLTEDSINAQLIPADILKKNKFKSNWPFGKKEQHRKLSMTSEDGDNNQSFEDSFLAGREQQSDSDASDEDQGSNTSEDLEERLAGLDRMQEEQQYLSLESGPQSQLLNDQWDYSNSNDQNLNSSLMQSYPQHDDRIIEEELIRELNQNRADSSIDDLQDEDEDLLQEDLDSDDSAGDVQGEEDEEQGDIEQESRDLSQAESFIESSGEEGSFSDYFSSSASQDGREALSSRQQLIIEHKEEEQFYEHVMDVLSYEKINVVPKISRIQVNQVFNLRFFLQLYDYPQRKLENARTQRIKSGHQLLEEKKVEESLELLKAFKFDRSLSLCHYIEMNQVYRYDFFMKSMPVSEAALSKMFTDEHTSVIARRRRNGIVHRGDLIEVMPGGWEVVGGRRVEEVRRRREMAEEDLGAPLRRNIRRPLPINQIMQNRPFQGHQLQPNFTIRIIPNQRLNAVESQSSSNPIISEEDIDNDALSGSIPEEQLRDMPEENQAEAVNNQRFRQEFEYGNEEISQILRELNMNMTPQEFHMLSAQVQNDIIQNYYMIGPQQHINPPNSPALIQQRDEMNHPVMMPEIRRPGEFRQPDMSPILGLQQLDSRVQAVSPQNVAQNAEGTGNMQEQFRKMSMEHIAKVNKDVMQMINKEGKNNSKFYQLQDSQLAYIVQLFYDLNQKDHKHYPYNLIETLCVNTNNLHRFLSTCVALLHLALEGHQAQAFQAEHFIFKYLEDPQNRIVLVVKILHLLYHLTGNYSIAMNLLEVNDHPIQLLYKWMSSSQKEKSSLEMLILQLHSVTSLKSPEALKFIIDLIENVTVHHFYKSIHSLVGNTREPQTTNDDINKPIQITKESAHLLGNLLQNDLMMENLHSISRIIMRLSLNDTNLGYFIAFMEHLISQLAQNSLKEIYRICALPEAREDKKYSKIVNLMNIFFEMVISFKSYPTSQEKHSKVLNQLRRIVEIEALQQLCETAATNLFASHDTNIQTVMGQILEVYFILYEIALATSDQSVEKKYEDLQHKHIAELGQIKEMRIHQSTELKKQEQIMLGKFNLSKMWRESITHPVFKTYINNCIKKKLNNLTQEPTWATLGIFQVPIFKVAISTPHMLTFDNKRLIFKTELKRLKKKAKSHLIHMQLSRQEVFEDSFAEIMHYNQEVLKGKLKIQFKNEEGEDAGGITREWFQLLSKKMFDPNYGLFKSGSSGNTYHPSEKSYINPLHLKYFKFIGRITGKALYDGYLLDAYFTPAFYKHILNLPITYLDMEEQDYEYFKSLKWILDNSPIEDYLELNFNYSFDNFGQIQTKELFPGGGEKSVTEENKYQYVQLISYAKMATTIKKQLQAFLEGFHDLIPHKLIKIFNEKELEIMISGRPTIDIDDLKNNTDLVNYVKNDQIIVWLFQVLESFDMELRTAFLQFVTGSSRVPVEGFKDLRGMNGVQKFNIHREFQEERLPRAHTCFNQLDLPNYKTKQILIDKLMLAITEGKEGFHMI